MEYFRHRPLGVTKLFQLGRITLDPDSAEFNLALGRIRIWPLDQAVCREIGKLDIRSDPADEIIAATSIAYNIPLVTRDQVLRKSKRIPLA